MVLDPERPPTPPGGVASVASAGGSLMSAPLLEPDPAIRNLVVRTSTSILFLQRRAEQELRDAKAALESQASVLAGTVALLHATLEASPDGILAVDRQGRIVARNARALDMLQLPDGDLTTLDVPALAAHRESQSHDTAALLSLLTATIRQPDREASDTVQLPTGRTFERWAVPQIVGDECVGTVTYWREHTERLRIQAAQRQLEEQLLQSQKMESLGALAGGIAHDFNNILGAILGNVDLAQRGVLKDSTLGECLTEIHNAGHRASRLVQQILTFSRQQRTDMQVVDIMPVVEEAARLLRATIPAGITLRVDIEDALPRVAADTTQLHQVIVNLCTNATHSVQASFGRSTRDAWLHVRVSGCAADEAVHRAVMAAGHEPAEQYVCIVVEDNGMGIDAATQARMFEPFFTTRPIGEGTGLGLSVVHGIVAAHQGAIFVESEQGHGARVSVYLPALSALQSANELLAPIVDEPPVLPAHEAERTMRVLYVDDEPMMISLVVRMLKFATIDVIPFSSVGDAVAEIANGHADYDCVVTDFNMPGGSGFDVAAATRARWRDVPIVLTTGYVTEEIEEALRDIPNSHLIYKPELSRQLVPLLRKLGPYA